MSCWLWIAQLVAQGAIDDTFALCFGGIDGGGAFLLGDVNVPPYTQNLAYTRLTRGRSTVYYYISLLRLRVNGTLLPVTEVRMLNLALLPWHSCHLLGSPFHACEWRVAPSQAAGMRMLEAASRFSSSMQGHQSMQMQQCASVQLSDHE